MTIRDVKIWNFSEFFRDGGYSFGVIYHPEGMSEAIGRYEIIFGSACGSFAYNILKHFVVRESEEHRFDICIVASYVLHAVFLFITACELMLFDSSFHVVGHPCSNHEAILCAAIHGLCVDIVVLLVILHKPAVFLEFPEVFNRFVVDSGIMLVKTYFEINLRFDDMVKTFFITLRFFTGFLAVEDIIRAGCHFFNKMFRRTYPLEWFDSCHGSVKVKY